MEREEKKVAPNNLPKPTVATLLLRTTHIHARAHMFARNIDTIYKHMKAKYIYVVHCMVAISMTVSNL